jgi:ABC-type transport system involved in multi-copper enzyme maturation permease subunit
MSGPEIIYAVRWLIRDTFRQAVATRIFWIMLAVSGLCIAFCLSVGTEGGESLRRPGEQELFDRNEKPFVGTNRGDMTLLFGAVRFELARDAESGVHFLQVLLGTWVAGTAGLLLTLVWTAGFVPEFLHPSAASVLFAKPIPRWALLAGKFLGVVIFVAFQALIFFGGTWLALGLRTDVWLYGYLAGILVLVLHFAVIYSFAVLLAVCTRSPVACIFGSVLFWLVCFGMNYGRHATLALPDIAPGVAPLPASATFAIEAGYWILPKPADMVMILEQAFEARQHFSGLSDLPEFAIVCRTGAFWPELSLLTSLVFCLAMLMIAGRHLATTDY